MILRLATYNFLRGGSRNRTGHLARVRAEFAPDIVLCQEARAPAVAATAGNEDPVSAKFFWRPTRRNSWGSGVFVSARPAAEVRVPGFSGWVSGVELELRRRTHVFSVHCPAGRGGYVQVMRRLLDRIRRVSKGAEIVLGGDFNVACGYRPADDVIRFTRGERELLDRMRDVFGLVPAWQTAHPGVPLAQTLRWSANRSTPYHCDGIFVPAAWRVRRCEVGSGDVWNTMSDHNPVFAECEVV